MTHLATRDAVLSSRTGSLDSYSVEADNGVHWAILGPVPGDTDRVYARGYRGGAAEGLVLLVTRTGTAHVRGKGAQVRVRLDFPRDTNDLAGTLAFDGDHIGGVAPAVLFG